MCMAELYSKSQPTTSQILSDSSVRSVERAIEVLFSFTQQEPVLDIPALQQRTGLSRPTALVHGYRWDRGYPNPAGA